MLLLLLLAIAVVVIEYDFRSVLLIFDVLLVTVVVVLEPSLKQAGTFLGCSSFCRPWVFLCRIKLKLRSDWYEQPGYSQMYTCRRADEVRLRGLKLIKLLMAFASLRLPLAFLFFFDVPYFDVERLDNELFVESEELSDQVLLPFFFFSFMSLIGKQTKN